MGIGLQSLRSLGTMIQIGSKLALGSQFVCGLWVWAPIVPAATAASSYQSFHVHEIDPGRFVRSSQLPHWVFEDLVVDKGIKTVINLRGPQSQKAWYSNQVAVVRKLGIRQIDIPMTARKIPTRGNLIQLLDAFRTAERPLLVHCEAGIDRTGEASAIYQMLYMGLPKEKALEMLSLRFGYFGRGAYQSKRYFIESLWQGEEWARAQYFPCSRGYQYFDGQETECTAR